jgi:tRNA nucleotidyltransferase (CCA-adding enzyme)
MQVYLVGGAVRDELLDRPVGERDWVVVGATPGQMASLGYRQVGRDFPVFLHPQTNEEYALARTERKSAPGYRGFTVEFSPAVTLEQDLARRDLTINAMARAADGTLIDPFDGRGDLERRRLRHVSPAFAEDPVRVLRLGRFAARYGPLGFHVAEDTIALVRTMAASGELDSLVPERVWQETDKALGEADPAAFFEVLRASDALARIFPEIARLFGVPQPERWHPEIDTGVHTLMSVTAAARVSPDRTVRFAALVHDLGKADTPRERWPSHVGHEERSARLVNELCARLRVPNEYRDLGVLAARHHGAIHRAAELRPATIVDLLEATDALRRPARFEQLLLACEADARGRTGLEDSAYPQADRLRRARASAAQVVPTPEELAAFKGPALAEQLHKRRIDAVRRDPGGYE